MLDIAAWPGLRLVEPVTGGNRNEVWQGLLDGEPVAIRRSRRTSESLAWELDLIEYLAARDFWVPEPVRTKSGDRSANDIVVQRWLDGHEPASEHDWQQIARELQRLHELTAGYPQRPGCCVVTELEQQRRSVDADLDALPQPAQSVVLREFERLTALPVRVIHGDPWAPNLRISGDRVGLLDWDESRVDLTWHDLSNLGTQVLNDADHAQAQRLSHAWEAVNGWVVEPDYAQTRLQKLTVSD